MPNRCTRADDPLIFYAQEDRRTLDLLQKHLLTLDISPDEVVLPSACYSLTEHLKAMKEERLIVILVSVDSLVILMQRMAMLAEMMKQREARFGQSGMISILCRPCAGPGTALEQTNVLAHEDYVPITYKGKIDQACLDTARRVQSYLHQWDKTLLREQMSPKDLELAERYGPPGVGDHQIGETITFSALTTQAEPAEITGTLIYVTADSKYVIQVPSDTAHHLVRRCDVIERRQERHG